MKRKFLLQVLQFLIFSVIAVLFFRYLYGGEDLTEIARKLLSINPVWVLYSMLMALASHLSRAARWCLAIRPLGYKASVARAFLAVLFGYFVNSLPVPRLGEFARCWLFAKTEQVPVSISLGAVIAERVVDLVMLFSITTLAILLEYNRLINFLGGLYDQSGSSLENKFLILLTLGLLVLVGMALAYRFKGILLRNKLIQKIISVLISLKQGVLGLSKLSKRGLAIYLAHSLFIWAMYYGMAYILIFAMSETEHLPAVAGLTMVAMGGIGMAFPTPAGAGSYHYFMTQALILYAVAEGPAKEFALLLHTSQVVMAWATGSLAFGVSYLLKPRNSAI